MKIFSWNVRGLGSRKKRGVIKDFLRHHQPDRVVLRETKVEVCERRFMQSLWGVRHRRWVCLPASGRSGGGLILWDERVVSECETIVGEFSLSIRFRNLDNSEWWLTGVYGPNRPSRRKDFWEELAGLFGLCSPNWCVGGVFNVV